MHDYKFPDLVIKAINSEPALQSMLYDIDMLPEQVAGDVVNRNCTCMMAAAFMAGKIAALKEPKP
jgi:hypothetical protein